jgi:hypothetical protein
MFEKLMYDKIVIVKNDNSRISYHVFTLHFQHNQDADDSVQIRSS